MSKLSKKLGIHVNLNPFHYVEKVTDWTKDRLGINNPPPTMGAPMGTHNPYQVGQSTNSSLGGYRPPSVGSNGAMVNNSTQPVIPPIQIEGTTDPGKIAAAGQWIKEHLGALNGLSEMEKWSIALNAVGGAFNAYSQYRQGEQANARSKEELAERAREFDASQKESARQFNLPNAVSLSRSNDLAPLRDRAAYLIGARLGMNSTPFVGGSITNPAGMPGGVDPNAMASANNAYTDWAGGTKPGVDLRKRILDTLGYGS